MRVAGQQLRSFLRAVHRRLILVRIIESIGGGVVAGSIAALPLVTLQLWRHEPALPAAILMMLVGAAGGALFALRTWPSRMQAAHEADKQLNLTDLLTTAVAMQDLQDDPWAASVLAMAEARCGEVSTSELVLHRWGVRAWGGMGLTAALVLAVSLLGSNPKPLRARENAPSARLTSIPQNSEALNSDAPASPDAPLKRDNRSDDPSAAESDRTVADPGNHADAQNLRDGNGADGERAGTTDSAYVPPIVRSPGGSDSASAGDQPADGGDESVHPSLGSSAAPGTAEATGGSVDVPPWDAPSWPQDRKRAMQAIRDGEIPDAYRELIREYFTPDRP